MWANFHPSFVRFLRLSTLASTLALNHSLPLSLSLSLSLLLSLSTFLSSLFFPPYRPSRRGSLLSDWHHRSSCPAPEFIFTVTRDNRGRRYDQVASLAAAARGEEIEPRRFCDRGSIDHHCHRHERGFPVSPRASSRFRARHRRAFRLINDDRATTSKTSEVLLGTDGRRLRTR